ncbi:immunoglobulin-like domain-containing protein [Bifidobacterium sp. ESL0704]|uniref:immunoglobulin-like domain-containing protein n=1 Tax=Bifidobacterium sp. ESL0704 TaxID=2983219 RepID=UPI0023F7F1F4|nr:immunoglobulin-like domain-containing protein [Bifidobacterium sp. ESL0704]WEV52129.1 Ig-like domain-containing protein [Bifidobacterium sp. ESL0704]
MARAVGLASCVATALMGLVVAPGVAGAAEMPSTPDAFIADSQPVAHFDFNDVCAGQTGDMTDGLGNKATIHGAAKLSTTKNDVDKSQGLFTSKDFWLSVKNKNGDSPLKGLHAVTISYDSRSNTDASNQGWTVFAARDNSTQQYQQEHYLGVLDTKTYVTMQRYNNSGSRNESGTAQAGGQQKAWKHVDLVVTDETSEMYINGKLAATGSPDSASGLASILGASGGILQIGKANWGDGEYYPGFIDNLKIYDSTKPAAKQALGTMAVPKSTTKDFNVPTSTNGVSVRWSSSDTSAVSVDQGTGKVTVTQPTNGKDATVTLTAKLDGHGLSDSKTYTVTVPHVLSDTEKVDADLKAASIDNANDMRTNFSVTTKGVNGSTISWAIKNAGKANPRIGDGINDTSKSVTVSRPASGSPATTMTLSATATLNGVSHSKDFDVKVQPMPSKQGKDQAYVWAFFTGEGVGGEKVSLAASKGDNALDWNTLNNGTPLFTSAMGEKGLRDPFIMKSKDGDKFYMIATDLKISGRANAPGGAGGFMGAQVNGSKSIEIWESDDLVNWSNQRQVKVSSDLAGNTWAPEAYYDSAIGKYVVYWASNLYDSASQQDRTKPTYNRMVYVTTDDFVNFSTPTTWIDVDRRGQDGSGSIDATVQKDGDTYYRVYKDEKTMTLRQEKSTDLLATVAGTYPADASGPATNQWSTVATQIGKGSVGYNGHFNGQGEGPSLFKANDGDVNGYQYYLFADQPNYHHNQEGNSGPNHYVPFATKDISAGQWEGLAQKMPDGSEEGGANNFPTNSDGGKPRHGTVLPVTRAQYQKVLEAYAPAVAVTSVDAIDVTTKVGENPTSKLPASVNLTHKDGSKSSASVKWEAIKPASYDHAGTFTVNGLADDDSRMPVQATVTVKADESTPVTPPAPTAPKLSISGPGVSNGTLTMRPGQETTVSATYTAEGSVDGKTVTWTSSDPSVVGLKKGLTRDSGTDSVTLVALKAGKATVSAEVEGVTTSIAVNVSAKTTVGGSGEPAKTGRDPQQSGKKQGELSRTGASVTTLIVFVVAVSSVGVGLILLRRQRW